MAGACRKDEKAAEMVMGTNDSSIVSKRSVEFRYYHQPHFFRYFVKKMQRRAPLINRGYWLRMYAVAETVRRFLAEPSDRSKFVLNFGCGFDPLPFQFLGKEESLCTNAIFIDIDYERLIVDKNNVIRSTKEIMGILENVEFSSDNSVVLMRSKHYISVGCDLRHLRKLNEALGAEASFPQSSVLCVAEVSLTYMDVDSANAVISWASGLSNGQINVRFCLLEQFFPDGPDHPFASTMMRHFSKLQAPLHSIQKYPSLSHQEKRFIDGGWRHAHARSLWNLWQDNLFLNDSQRTSLDTYEPFDEWEEFALFASHYFLLLASTGENGVQKARSKQMTSYNGPPPLTFSLLSRHPPRFDGQRRYGALIPDGNNSLGVYGGLGRKSRLPSTDIYTNSDNVSRPLRALPPQDIPARMCHTVTSLNNSGCLVVGGRSSPTAGLSDCWIRHGDKWQQSHRLPLDRFRHCAVRLDFCHFDDCVLVYGGKAGNGDVLNDWLLWCAHSEWQSVEVVGERPGARFGASMISINGHSGVLFGGMTQDGRVLEDFWTWTVSEARDGFFSVDLNDRTHYLRDGTPLSRFIGRFGATANITSLGLVIIGGVCTQGILPLEYEIILIKIPKDRVHIDSEAFWNKIVLSPVGLGVQFRGPRPLFNGHISCTVSPSEILILGGGAVCFSFGTYWNEGTWLLAHDVDSAYKNRWLLVPKEKPTRMTQGEIPTRTMQEASYFPSTGNAGEMTKIESRNIQTSVEFQELIVKGKPVVIPGANLGRCTVLWTKEYLANTIGPDRKVVVHEARSDHMNFHSKNFSYVTKSFGTFLNEVYAGSRQYLRATSAEQPSRIPANLAADFPELREDFRLPEALSFAADNVHSSPLRISGPVTIWLHYDVMANVLCQIRGEKRLILYPPTDVQYLHLPAGASSSTIDIFQDHSPRSVTSIPHTSPHEIVLRPGDILFIPPLWLHTASPIGGVSIAVNVFFRNLSKGYAAGRDVYANRDLQAYEKGRSDLKKIVGSFEGLPPDMARFYLLRLASELREMVDGIPQDGPTG